MASSGRFYRSTLGDLPVFGLDKTGRTLVAGDEQPDWPRGKST